MTALAAQQGEDLPTSPEKLLNILKELSISYELHHHQAVYTVAESQQVDSNIAGTHCRNLFLRDRKKKNYLVVLPTDLEVDLKKLPDILESHRLSFGSNDRLWEFLGVRSALFLITLSLKRMEPNFPLTSSHIKPNTSLITNSY